MRLMIKAAGPRTIVVGSTGCMYVANTTYYSTPWVVPWMHTQLGSSGSAATGTAAGLASLMRKGKMQQEPINVIAFCGDGGGVDMGLSAISAALQHDEYNLLILCYDNESYANTDIQVSGSSPWGANSTFSPPGKVHRIMNHRWKKNTAPMLAAGHPDVRYIATACGSYGPDFTNKIRRGAHHRRARPSSTASTRAPRVGTTIPSIPTSWGCWPWRPGSGCSTKSWTGS